MPRGDAKLPQKRVRAGIARVRAVFEPRGEENVRGGERFLKIILVVSIDEGIMGFLYFGV